MEHAFTWMSLIPGVSDHTATATLVSVVLIGLAWMSRRQLAAASDPIVPDGTMTVRNTMEIYVEQITDIVEGVLGHRGREFVHLFGSFFLFIFVANLWGLIPGFSPPTDNFNITFALGVVSFLTYNYYGIKVSGSGYLKHFVGPIWWLGFLMVPLELIDNFVRPVSLALRLFGNMTGDHLVLGIFTDLTKLVIPVVFYVLGAFVSLIQAFVFTLLSVIYVSLALPHDHH